MKVNEENVRAWVDALRSGKYAQGQGVLHQKVDGQDLYCCLGVACDISPVGEWQVMAENEDGSIRYTFVAATSEDDRSWTALPASVVEWLGLPQELGSGNPRLQGAYAVHLNDEQGLSFEEIADRVEREFLSGE